MKVSNIELVINFSMEEVILIRDALATALKQAEDSENSYFNYSEVESLIIGFSQII